MQQSKQSFLVLLSPWASYSSSRAFPNPANPGQADRYSLSCALEFPDIPEQLANFHEAPQTKYL